MSTYNVKHTDSSVPSIAIESTETDDSSLDVSLFGRIKREYGESLNENLLNILENFACPEISGITNFILASPNLSQTTKTQLHNPTTGQFWYNMTRGMVYYWNGSEWYPLSLRENYAANWGILDHGQQLPKPISPVTGHVFEYSDCIWSVSPSSFPGKVGFMNCATDSNAKITMQYRLSGTNTMLPGMVNYLIVGIRGNYNAGQNMSPIAPTPTPSVTPTSTPQGTPASTITSTPSNTPDGTPGGTPVSTPTSTPPVTPGTTPPTTPAVTSTPAVTVSETPPTTPPGTPPNTPASTPPNTPPDMCGGMGCPSSVTYPDNCGCPPGYEPILRGCRKTTSPFNETECP